MTDRELRATGATLRRRDVAARDELTPQEHQIAMLVVDGASNKDVAASMFLSPKTIETHLSRIYRKLGVRSRHRAEPPGEAVRCRSICAHHPVSDAETVHTFGA